MKTVGSGGGGGDAQMVRLLVSGLLLDADPGVVKVGRDLNEAVKQRRGALECAANANEKTRFTAGKSYDLPVIWDKRFPKFVARGAGLTFNEAKEMALSHPSAKALDVVHTPQEDDKEEEEQTSTPQKLFGVPPSWR